MKNKALQGILVSRHRGQRGAVIILVAVLMVAFIGLAALAIDVSHLYVVRNELQNAADAGALAGARVLYIDAGVTINPNANQEAFDAATANKALTATGAVPVDVNWTVGADNKTADVQIGNWSFVTRQFIPTNDILVPFDPVSGLFNNAVRVVARRDSTPAASFFARIFGYDNFKKSAEAVAYIGTFPSPAFGQPIAICKQSITNPDGTLSCNTGRMSNSGSDAGTHNTAAWTNFSQDPCETATPPSLAPLVCTNNNPEINLGSDIGSTGGEQANVARDLRDCWKGQPGLQKDFWGYPREKWSVTLPVIDCPGNNPGNCSTVVGAVTVDVVWINGGGADPQWQEVPVQMDGWECSLWVAAGRPTPPNRQNLLDATARQQCWQEFANQFNLKTYGGTSVGDLPPNDLKSALYFLPDCDAALQGPGGIAEILKKPVLVE